MEAKRIGDWPDDDGDCGVLIDFGDHDRRVLYVRDEATALVLTRRINTPSEERQVPEGVEARTAILACEWAPGWDWRKYDGDWRTGQPPMDDRTLIEVRRCSAPKVEPLNAALAVMHRRKVHVVNFPPSVAVAVDGGGGGAAQVRTEAGWCAVVDPSGCVSVLAEDQP